MAGLVALRAGRRYQVFYIVFKSPTDTIPQHHFATAIGLENNQAQTLYLWRRHRMKVRALVAAENRAREEATVCAVYREALARELEGIFSTDSSLAGSSSQSEFGEHKPR